jgi:hypothetical protein
MIWLDGLSVQLLWVQRKHDLWYELPLRPTYKKKSNLICVIHKSHYIIICKIETWSNVVEQNTGPIMLAVQHIDINCTLKK